MSSSLSTAAFHILLALANENQHGYGILLEVKALTGGAVHLGPGTLYGTIKRLLIDGLIEEAVPSANPSVDAPPEDERRRYYRLTAIGREEAEKEALRLDRLVATARARRLLAPVREAEI